MCDGRLNDLSLESVTEASLFDVLGTLVSLSAGMRTLKGKVSK